MLTVYDVFNNVFNGTSDGLDAFNSVFNKMLTVSDVFNNVSGS